MRSSRCTGRPVQCHASFGKPPTIEEGIPSESGLKPSSVDDYVLIDSDSRNERQEVLIDD